MMSAPDGIFGECIYFEKPIRATRKKKMTNPEEKYECGCGGKVTREGQKHTCDKCQKSWIVDVNNEGNVFNRFPWEHE